ncbi:hypothetical protein BJ085DRAFT_39687 [Dimargaris cristalligena]|uniref:Tip elongation aberrant protein 1 n=1 Tax=Dimargaris cristalligena TaxID=215637 RepID=A0A4P9ZLB3_9FUNG|nr:hypothetical protein BJ085DRAFT_39687 [Dimargaris cristalligena]|eukprot:RKP33878.1 hypothetical protein BJ085DRAFT_39687 [Dimargaris cristalligena]
MSFFNKLKGSHSSHSQSTSQKRSTSSGLPPTPPARAGGGLHSSFSPSQPPPAPPPKNKRVSAVTQPGSSTASSSYSSMASPATGPTAGPVVQGGSATPGDRSNIPCAKVSWKGFKHPEHPAFPRNDFSLAFDGQDAYVFGGRAGSQYMSDLVQFNPRNLNFKTIETAGTPPSPRIHHCAIFIGRAMLVFGGRLSDGSFDDSQVYMYTLQHSRWFTIKLDGQAFRGRQGHACSLYGHAMCVSFGVTRDGYANDIALFDLRTVKHDGARWQFLSPVNNLYPPKRAFHSSCIYDNKLYIFGGCDSERFFNDLWVFDLVEKTWSILKPQGEIPPPRASHSSFIIDGYMVILGGQQNNKKITKDTYAYNLSANLWFHAGTTDRAWTRRPGGRFLATRDRLFYLGGHVPESETPFVVFTVIPSVPIETNAPSPGTSSVSLGSFVDKKVPTPPDYSQPPLPIDSVDISSTSANSTFHSLTAELNERAESPILNTTISSSVQGTPPSIHALGINTSVSQIPSPSSQTDSQTHLPTEFVSNPSIGRIHHERSTSQLSKYDNTSQPPVRISHAVGRPFSQMTSDMDRRGSQMGSEGSLPSPKDSDEFINTGASRSRQQSQDRRSDKRLTIELRNRLSIVRSPSIEGASSLSERLSSSPLASDPELVVQRVDSLTSLGSDRRLSINVRSPLSNPVGGEGGSLGSGTNHRTSPEFRADNEGARRGADSSIAIKKSGLRQVLHSPPGESSEQTTLLNRDSEAANPTQDLVNDAWRTVDTVVTSSPYCRNPDGSDAARSSPTHSFPINTFNEEQIQAIQEDPIKAKLMQALLRLHQEVEDTRTSVTTLSNAAVERIADAERSRQNALQEALYLRAKWQAIEESNSELLQQVEVVRTSQMERQMANLINDNSALRTQLHEASSQLEQTHQRLNDAHRTIDSGQSDQSQLHQLYADAREELEALSAHQSVNGQARGHTEAEVQSVQADLDARFFQMEAMHEELEALRQSDKKTQSIIQSTLEATKLANGRATQLQDQLSKAYAQIQELESDQMELRHQLERQTAALNRAARQTDDANNQREMAEAQLRSLGNLATLVDEADLKEEVITKLQDQLNRSAARIKKLETELRQTHTQIEAYALVPPEAGLGRSVRFDSGSSAMGEIDARGATPSPLMRPTGTADSAASSIALGPLSVPGLQQKLRNMEAKFLQTQRDLNSTKRELSQLRQSLRETDDKRLAAETQLQSKAVQLEDALAKLRAFVALLQDASTSADGNISGMGKMSLASIGRYDEKLEPIAIGPMLNLPSIRNAILGLDPHMPTSAMNAGASHTGVGGQSPTVTSSPALVAKSAGSSPVPPP